MGAKGWAAAAAATWCLAAPAGAEWLQARSRHFTIYSDTRPADLQALAERLERFDAAMRRLSGSDDPAEAAANPVTIYVTDSVADIERLAGEDDVAGFYVPRADGAVAFTPRVGRDDGRNALKPQIVLFHEYAHHFLLGSSEVAYPAWYSEGYAELMSTTAVGPDAVQFGVAAQHRAYGLLVARKLPIELLLAPSRRLTPEETEQLYGRGWLLTHYTTFDPVRRKQMAEYLRLFATGAPPIDAAKQAFGDLRQLDRDLEHYLGGRTLPGMRVGVAQLPPVSVAIRPLSAGERALIELRVRSERGVNAKTAGPLYARAKRASVPADDAVAQGWLAEMAYDAADDAGAEAAADRALAADPRSSQALMYKGRVHLRRAVQAKAADPKTWSEARSWVVKANRLNPDDAAPLALFYDSFAMAGAKPSKSAVVGLHRALELVPQDGTLRFKAARQHLIDGDLPAAKRALRPLAYAPHLGPDNPAAKLIALIDAGAPAAALTAAADQGGKASD